MPPPSQSAADLRRSYGQSAPEELRDIALINGRIHTMDANNRVVSQALIRNGRILQWVTTSGSGWATSGWST